MKEVDLDVFEALYRKRYQMKKKVNIIVSAIVFILGVASVIYIFVHDRDGILTFRWMTVNGTVFTTCGAAVFIVVNLVEIFGHTEMSAVPVYYIRLSCAVAEGLILFVVLMSQLPFFAEHMHIFRFDMFNMHILLPVLTIASFVLNDTPIGKLRGKSLIGGMWFLILYTVFIVLLICGKVISGDMIPYFFLDFYNMSLLLIITSFVIIYGLAYLLSFAISECNRKLSWMWFKGIIEEIRG